jgi:hypothetical protein
MPFAYKNVLITGATSGIGLALTERLIEEGIHVIAVGRRADRLADLDKKHGAAKVTPEIFDVSDLNALGPWAKRCVLALSSRTFVQPLAPPSSSLLTPNFLRRRFLFASFLYLPSPQNFRPHFKLTNHQDHNAIPSPRLPNPKCRHPTHGGLRKPASHQPLHHRRGTNNKLYFPAPHNRPLPPPSPIALPKTSLHNPHLLRASTGSAPETRKLLCYQIGPALIGLVPKGTARRRRQVEAYQGRGGYPSSGAD